jgi:hypothetical protein
MPAYQDPSNVKLENGRSMAEAIRPGPYGLKGVVVGKATAGGTPVNYDPHDMSKVRINIVSPDGRNVNSLGFDQMTQERVNAAIAAAEQQLPGDDIDTIRERAAMVFEELAKTTKSGVQKTPVRRSPPARRPEPEDDYDEVEIVEELQEEIAAGVNPPPVPATAPPIEKIDRSYSPLAAFGLKKQSSPPSQVGGHSAVGSARVGPPQKLVYFEKEGIGTVPAFFHDVIVSTAPADDDAIEESGFMVLIYDLRFDQNAARWFPPANDPYQRPWAVQINEDSKLYLVHTTGFQYVYDNREYCVLLVERAVMSTGI